MFKKRFRDILLFMFLFMMIFSGCSNKDDSIIESSHEPIESSGLGDVSTQEHTLSETEASTEEVEKSYLDDMFIFRVDNTDFYLTDKMSKFLKHFDLIDKESLLSDRFYPRSAGTVVMYNETAVIIVGVYNDSNKMSKLQDCKVGYIQILSPLAYNTVLSSEEITHITNNIKFQNVLTMQNISFRNIHFNMPLQELTKSIGNYVDYHINEERPDFTNYKWVDKDTHLDIAYNSSDQMLGLSYGLRGVFFNLTYSSISFDKNCVMIANNEMFKLNIPLYEYTKRMPEANHFYDYDLNYVMQPGETREMSLCFYRGAIKLDDIDVCDFIVFNNTDQEASIRDCIVIGLTVETYKMSDMTKHSIGFKYDIKLDDTLEDLLQAFGEPNKIEETYYETTFSWLINQHIVSVAFDDRDRIDSISYQLNIAK